MLPQRIRSTHIAAPVATTVKHRKASRLDHDSLMSRPRHSKQHSVDDSNSSIPLMTISSARWARLLKSLFIFRRFGSISTFTSSTSTSAAAPFTLALCMASVENIPNLFCPCSDLQSDSVYVSLEGPAVAGAAHRTPAATVDVETRCAVFSDRDPAVVARVSDARETRLALRCTSTGALLGDARLDVRALTSRSTACRLRIPIQMAGIIRRYGQANGRGPHQAIVTCLALAVRGRNAGEETSWDARPIKESRKNAADKWRIERRQVSDAALHPYETKQPSRTVSNDPHTGSATVVDVRRRLRSAMAAERREMNGYDDGQRLSAGGGGEDMYHFDDIDEDETLRQMANANFNLGDCGEESERDNWSDVDAATDIDEVSLKDLSSVFLTVDTARPVAHDGMLESAGLEWYARAKGATSGSSGTASSSRKPSVSDADIDENVLTKGAIEYL